MAEPAIACELHDYLEVACVYRYHIRLKLKNSQVIEGQAQDIINDNGHEYLALADGTRVELTTLKQMTVQSANAQFNIVDF